MTNIKDLKKAVEELINTRHEIAIEMEKMDELIYEIAKVTSELSKQAR